MRAILLAALLAVPAVAHAYPQFQLSTGAVRCNQCHYAPAGGGLINGYGRDEAGDTISMGGNGAFLHGLFTLPSWLAIGGDLRVAALYNHEDVDPTKSDTEFIPMQADLYTRVAFDHFSASVTLGIRGSARGEDALAAFISREHYLMWREGATGWYVRAGRFFAPFGLRVAEHTAYIRRFLGYDLLQEPYTLSGGFVEDEHELHVSAWIPDFVRDAVGEPTKGAAAYYERRVGEHAAWGAQTRLDFGDFTRRGMAGAVGKYYLEGPRIQLLAEADLVYQSFVDQGQHRWQFAGFLGGSWFPFRGGLVQLTLERWDEDMAVKGVARDAVDLELQWFPYAHIEVSLYGRVTLLGSGSDDGTVQKLGLLQFHYYL